MCLVIWDTKPKSKNLEAFAQRPARGEPEIY